MDAEAACPACGARLDRSASWCGQCLRAAPEPPPRPPRLNLRAPLEPAEPYEVEFSRTRGGPTSFGWVGRLASTLLLFVLAWCVYVYAMAAPFGIHDWRWVALYLVFAGPVMLVLLRRLWRRSRIL